MRTSICWPSPAVPVHRPQLCRTVTWVDTVLSNLKPIINGADKAFNFGKYATQCRGAFAYRFNRRVHLKGLLRDLLGHAVTASVTRKRKIRAMAEVRD